MKSFFVAMLVASSAMVLAGGISNAANAPQSADVEVGTTWEGLRHGELYKGYAQFRISYRESGGPTGWCSVQKIELRGKVDKKRKSIPSYVLASDEVKALENKSDELKCNLSEGKLQITHKRTREEVCNYAITLKDATHIETFDATCIETDVHSGRQSRVQYKPMESKYSDSDFISLGAPIEFQTITTDRP